MVSGLSRHAVFRTLTAADKSASALKALDCVREIVVQEDVDNYIPAILLLEHIKYESASASKAATSFKDLLVNFKLLVLYLNGRF